MENETNIAVNQSNIKPIAKESITQINNKFNSTDKSGKSLLNKINPLYENKSSDFENLEKIFENRKLVDMLNDPEINEDSLQKELSRIDKDYEKDVQNINLLEEYSTYFLNSLNNENNYQNKNLDKLLNEDSIFNENKDFNNKNQQKEDEEEYKDTQIDEIRQNKLMEKNILNLDLILKSVYRFQQIKQDGSNNKLTSDEEKEMLLNLNNLLLNDKKISKIQNLDIFEKLEELYLQRNLIIKIENFNHLKNLQILSLNNNFIKKIENLSHLSNLKILDLSDNLIKKFQVEELPKNLVYLYLFDNLFYDELDIFHFRYLCITNYPDLIRLDSLNINNEEKMYLPNFNERKINSTQNLNLKKRLNHISEHYKIMRKDRVKVLNEYMEYLNGTNLYTESSINYSENNSENLNSIPNSTYKNISIPGTPITNNNVNNLSIQISDINDDNSTINSSKIARNNPDYKNLNLQKLSQKVIDEEKQLVDNEIKYLDKGNTDFIENVKEIKERSKQRKAEFESNFWVSSEDIKQDLEEIKNKFKTFNNRVDRIKKIDMESKIKERMNFDQRINKVDEKIKDIDILSRSLGEKINEMKTQIDNPETFGFFNY